MDINKFNEIYDKIKIIQENDLKMSTSKTILKNILALLAKNHVEGRYHDESWAGVRKLERILREFGVDYELQSADYKRDKDSTSQLPNKKVYTYMITFTDNNQKTHNVKFIVTCAFVGRTGTMEDDVYELTYYFAN